MHDSLEKAITATKTPTKWNCFRSSYTLEFHANTTGSLVLKDVFADNLYQYLLKCVFGKFISCFFFC